MENFSQVCVWEYTTVGADNVKTFEDWIQSEFGVRAKYCDEVDIESKPDGLDRTDLFFRIHDEDIQKFAAPRLKVGIRWWEDVLGNGNGHLYPQAILEKYPKTW